LRPLFNTELAPFVGAGTLTNVGLASNAGGYLTANTTLYSLTLERGGGVNITGPVPDSYILTLGNNANSGAILAKAGNTGINGGMLSVAAANNFYFWTPGADTVLNLNSAVTTSTANLVKDGAGTLNVNVRQLAGVTTVLNGGTIRLAGGDNRLYVGPTGATNALVINNGVLDLNGTNQAVAAFSSSNTTPGAGGLVTNLASGAPVTFTVNGTGTFAGSVGGNLNFTRSGNTNTTLVNDNPYTGVTTIRGGGLILQQGGRLSGTSALNSNFGTLTLDNATNSVWDISQRIGSAVPFNFLGGGVVYTGYPGMGSATTIGTLNLSGGVLTLNASRGNALGNATMTVNALTRSSDATVNFTVASGALGQAALGNSQIFFGSIGGVSPVTLAAANNGILGGWATVGGTDFAGYVAAGSLQGGVGALGHHGFPPLFQRPADCGRRHRQRDRGHGHHRGHHAHDQFPQGHDDGHDRAERRLGHPHPRHRRSAPQRCQRAALRRQPQRRHDPQHRGEPVCLRQFECDDRQQSGR
jgi:autotransporter-associated beta strand protein